MFEPTPLSVPTNQPLGEDVFNFPSNKLSDSEKLGSEVLGFSCYKLLRKATSDAIVPLVPKPVMKPVQKTTSITKDDDDDDDDELQKAAMAFTPKDVNRTPAKKTHKKSVKADSEPKAP